MLRYKNLGYTMEVTLPLNNEKYKGYSALCTYRYDKSKDEYLLHMWLKYIENSDMLPIDSQEIDTQYIGGDKDTIRDNILKIVEQASEPGFFAEYIDKFEYYMDCFDKGNALCEANNDK